MEDGEGKYRSRSSLHLGEQDRQEARGRDGTLKWPEILCLLFLSLSF